jgi:hypothetical protein
MKGLDQGPSFFRDVRDDLLANFQILLIPKPNRNFWRQLIHHVIHLGEDPNSTPLAVQMRLLPHRERYRDAAQSRKSTPRWDDIQELFNPRHAPEMILINPGFDEHSV